MEREHYWLITVYSIEQDTYKTVAIDCSPAEFIITQVSLLSDVEWQVIWSVQINQYQYNDAYKIWSQNVWPD